MRLSRQRVALLALVALLPALAVTVAVFGSGDDGPARLPILSGAGTGDAMAAGDAATTELAYWDVTYEAGPNLPALDGIARAYRVAPLSDDEVRAIAAAFGLEDQLEPDGYEGWTATDGDRTLYVYPKGLSWSYYAGRDVARGVAGAEPGCAGPDCAVTSGPVTTIPAPVERPADLPSQDDAEAIARDLLATAGVAVDGAAVEVFDNETAWSFSFEPVVDGTRTFGFVASASVGAGGEIVDAYGTAGSIEAGDEYPLIGTAAAVDRLNRGEAFGPRVLGAPEDMPLPLPADDSGDADATTSGVAQPDVAVDVEPPQTTDTVCVLIYPPPPGCGGDHEMPIDPPVPAEPVVVTLTDAEVVLSFVPDVNGNGGWLVPAYRFSSDDEGVHVALAVADEFLTGATGAGDDAPGDTEPTGTDPAGSGGGSSGNSGNTGGSEPGTAPGSEPCAPLTEDDGSGTTHTVFFCDQPSKVEPTTTTG